MKKTVVLGMSGGVDSSVACYLLKEQGYNVIGVTMQIWQDEERAVCEDKGGCCGLSAVEDARKVANQLDVPFYVFNFKEEFKENVIDYFIDEYTKGNTPNPCIACNRYVKWESFLEKAMAIGADYIATGHYANIVELENGRMALKLSKTMAKDQTYALYNLTQDHLKRTIMPVGEYTKDEIRAIAHKIGIDVASKPDSQEICFIPDNDYAKYITENSPTKLPKGNFIDKQGNILGQHKGIAHYTIGQRKGLGIALGKPAFVTNIDVEKNEITLGDNEDLFTKVAYAKNINYMSEKSFDPEKKYTAKVRYSAQPAECTIKVDCDIMEVTFDTPQRAITRGQALVIYDGELVAGGGTFI